MNRKAENHLAKAKDYLAKGDEFYRKAKPEIEAAHLAGASIREVSRYLDRSKSWVADVLAWDGKDTLYGSDTERRRLDQARQVMREAPMEQVERIISGLPEERKVAVGAAAENAYLKVAHDHDERMRNITDKQRRQAEEASRSLDKGFVAPMQTLGVVLDLQTAAEDLRDLTARQVLTDELIEQIGQALEAFQREFEFAKQMLGEGSAR